MEFQKLLLDYVRTTAIILGIIFALVELRNATDENDRIRFQNTADMIAAFGREDLIEGASALLDAGRVEINVENYNLLLARLTPLRQHYITWAACLEYETCDKNMSTNLFCSRLIAYENAFRALQERFGKTYAEASRDEQYFGYIEKCGNQ